MTEVLVCSRRLGERKEMDLPPFPGDRNFHKLEVGKKKKKKRKRKVFSTDFPSFEYNQKIEKRGFE